MKKITMMMAVLLIATMSLGSMTAFAAEVPDGSGQRERPAFSENMKAPKGGFAFGMMRNVEGRERVVLTDEQKAAMMEKVKASLAGKLAAGEITQEQYDEAIAKIEEGNFAFDGMGFKGMNGKKPENMGDFKPEMPAFGGKDFKDMKIKPEGRTERTDEEKTAMIERIKTSLTEKLTAGEITQEQYDEAIAKIGTDRFPFEDKGFMGKPGKMAELTDEQKAAMMENIKSSLGDNFPAGKPMMPKKAVSGMIGEALQSVAAEEQ